MQNGAFWLSSDARYTIRQARCVGCMRTRIPVNYASIVDRWLLRMLLQLCTCPVAAGLPPNAQAQGRFGCSGNFGDIGTSCWRVLCGVRMFCDSVRNLCIIGMSFGHFSGEHLEGVDVAPVFKFVIDAQLDGCCFQCDLHCQRETTVRCVYSFSSKSR